LSRFGLLGLWELITPNLDLWLGWGLKQTCSSPQELFNGVSHSTCTHRGRVDSRLLVVGSQTANLTPGPSFDHNLCYRCPNGSCEAIFGIYTSRPFQRYKEHLKARYFDPYNRALKFWESWRTSSSHFWECKSHPHTCVKMGLRHIIYIKVCNSLKLFSLKILEWHKFYKTFRIESFKTKKLKHLEKFKINRGLSIAY